MIIIKVKKETNGIIIISDRGGKKEKAQQNSLSEW